MPRLLCGSAATAEHNGRGGGAGAGSGLWGAGLDAADQTVAASAAVMVAAAAEVGLGGGDGRAGCGIVPGRAVFPAFKAVSGGGVHAPEPGSAECVGRHLDRSQMLLVELANAPAGNPADQESAERLLEANRLYRVLAASAGETAVAELLDQMEILLTGVAHGDSTVDPASAEGILFKVRIVGSEVKEREERLQKGISTL